MGFWNRLFKKESTQLKTNQTETTKPEIESKLESRLQKEKEQLKARGLETEADLEKLLIPLIKETTKLELQAPSKAPDKASLTSYFGGIPYMESGEQWPTNAQGAPIDFILQIYNTGNINLPDEIELIQFFYDWEQFAWDTTDDGWLVKTYEKVHPEQQQDIKKPEQFDSVQYCKIDFKPVKSLPHWESLINYSLLADSLCSVLEEESDGIYEDMIEKLAPDTTYQSQIGGYPYWVQGEEIYRSASGYTLPLLLQIDSEDHANIMWGDAGLVYIFYDREVKKFYFQLQCY